MIEQCAWLIDVCSLDMFNREFLITQIWAGSIGCIAVRVFDCTRCFSYQNVFNVFNWTQTEQVIILKWWGPTAYRAPFWRHVLRNREATAVATTAEVNGIHK